MNGFKKIAIKQKNKFYFIEQENIKHIVSSAYYAEIFTADSTKHIIRISMSSFIKILNPNIFIRINRSTIINLNEIFEIVNEGLGDYSVIMKDNNYFSLSKIYKKSFFEKLGIKSIYSSTANQNEHIS